MPFLWGVCSMFGLRNHARFVLTVFAVCGLCFSSPHAQILAGKDESAADAKQATRDDAGGSAPAMNTQDAKRAKAKAKATAKKKGRPQTLKNKKAPEADSTA